MMPLTPHLSIISGLLATQCIAIVHCYTWFCYAMVHLVLLYCYTVAMVHNTHATLLHNQVHFRITHIAKTNHLCVLNCHWTNLAATSSEILAVEFWDTYFRSSQSLVPEKFAIGRNLRAAENSFAHLSSFQPHLWTKFAALEHHHHLQRNFPVAC